MVRPILSGFKLNTISRKPADPSLFSSACKAGAIEAEAKGEILDILANYGREIGLAYQLADDLVDLENGEMIDSVIIPLLTRLENKKIDNNSLKIKSIRAKIAKNSTKIKQLYLDEIKRHVKKAEYFSKSEMIPDSPYKYLLTNASCTRCCVRCSR